MRGAHPFRHQHFQRLAHQLVGRVSEDFFHRAVGRQNAALLVDHHNAVRGSFRNRAVQSLAFGECAFGAFALDRLGDLGVGEVAEQKAGDQAEDGDDPEHVAAVARRCAGQLAHSERPFRAGDIHARHFHFLAIERRAALEEKRFGRSIRAVPNGESESGQVQRRTHPAK
jgi:hypothetical protein